MAYICNAVKVFMNRKCFLETVSTIKMFLEI